MVTAWSNAISTTPWTRSPGLSLRPWPGCAGATA